MAEEQSNDNYQNSENQKEWYQHGWGLLFAILLFPFFLIWYAWAKSSWNKNTKIAVTVVCAIFIMFVMSIDSNYEPSDSSTADNNQEERENQEEQETEGVDDNNNSELTQEEIDEELMEEAEGADFVEVNAGDIEEGTALVLQGEVTFIREREPMIEFDLTTKEGDGYGIYSITTGSTLPNVHSFDEGDIMTVYGRYQGKNAETGMPELFSTVIRVE